MPYYSVGDYYGRGDYYRGDSIFQKLGRGLVGAVKGFVTGGGPIGAISGAIKGVRGPGTALVAHPPIPPLAPGGIRRSTDVRLFPPSVRTSFEQFGAPDPFSVDPKTGMVYTEYPGFRRRRMNPMNVRALRRASRRIDSFVGTARKALKHTQYTLVRRGSRKGSPGRITRAEAARALRG